MLSVKQFSFNHFQTNCYVLWDEDTKECFIIDPTPETSGEEHRLALFIDQNGLKVTRILLTHAHIDHIAGLKWACEKYHLPVTTHSDSNKLIRQSAAYADIMGFAAKDLSGLEYNYVNGGDKLTIGTESVECRYVPGHCPGSICYVTVSPQMVFTGDALFRGSIGRTDLPGGDHDLLMDKIRTELLPLHDDTVVLPGHGDCSTIGDEKNWNPFL